MAYTHPTLKCWVCGAQPATHVVEAKVLVDFTAHAETETYYQLSCGDIVCLELSAWSANSADKVHVDTYEISSREEAEAISGDDLSEVTS